MSNRRRRVVTPEPTFSLALVDPTSPILKLVDEIDSLVNHNAPQVPLVVELARMQIKSVCSHYASTKEEEPFFVDGFGILCASGRDGNGLFRGKLCARVCKVGDPDLDMAFVPAKKIQPARAVA